MEGRRIIEARGDGFSYFFTLFSLPLFTFFEIPQFAESFAFVAMHLSFYSFLLSREKKGICFPVNNFQG